MKTPEALLNDTYMVPSYWSFPPLEEINHMSIPAEQWSKLQNEEAFLFFNQIDNKVLLLNPTIKTFLDAFKSPKTLKKVIEEFAEIQECHPAEIAGDMAVFTADMLERGLIIEENAQQENIEKITEYDAEPFVTGDVFNGYIIQDLIVRNSKVDVYLAQKKDNKQQVVVKVLRTALFNTPEVKKLEKDKFIQEFKIQKNIDEHPHICKVLEVNAEVDNHYAILEYIEGMSLKEFVLTYPNQNLNERINLLCQMLSVIDHLHKNEVVHGDIHYKNFMVTPEQSIKIIDFGFANNVECEEGEYIHFGGFRQFIPPERLDKNAFQFVEGKSERTSEVFQAGVLAYFIIYGKLPFEGFTWKELAEQIENKNPECLPLTQLGEQIPKEVLHLIHKSMEKKPQNRFPSIADMLQSIQHYWIKLKEEPMPEN